MNTVIASMFVDPQKGFTSLCPSELPVPDGQHIVPGLMELYQLSTVHACSSDAHSPQALFVASETQPAFSSLSHENTDKAFPLHCVPGTPGFELLDGLPPVLSYDYMVWKGMDPSLHPYGACYHDLNNRLSTGLIEVFRARGVTHVLLGGLAADICVAITGFQLREAGFYVAMYMPATRGLTEQSTQTQCTDLQSAGVDILHDTTSLQSWVQSALSSSV